MQLPSGYKLIEIETGNEVQSLGGVYGHLTDPPNPLVLPNGDNVCAPEVGGEYGGYRLDVWMMDEPPPVVPESITRRQCALQLLAVGMITSAEAVEMARAGIPPASVQAAFDAMQEPGRTVSLIDFAAANYYRNNKLIPDLMAANGMEPADVDQFFIAASAL